MAYIPKDDDEQQVGMNVLSTQTQNQQPDAQNQPQNQSGGQSATIGSDQSQGPSQSPSAAPKAKKASSGMFTNIRKYINQNKDGAQRMSGKLQSNVSQQNQNIQQAIGKQKNDFMSRVNQNRQRMGQAQTFGQNTLQQAQTQQSQPMLQQQQQDMQQRYDQFNPNLTDQTQVMQQTQQNQATQQQAYDQAQQGYNQAQQNFNQQAQAFGQQLDMPIQSGQVANYEKKFNQFTGFTPTYYTQEQLQQGINTGNQDIIGSVDQALMQDQEKINQINQQLQAGTGTPESLAELNRLTQRLDSFQQYRQNLEAQNQAQGLVSTEQGKLDSLQDQYSRAQEQQRLFDNKTQLQAEMQAIQAKIDSAPEQLTQDDITRFNNLRTGVERFDDAILNLSSQNRQVEDLMSQAKSLETSQGRRDLMRQEFGRQGGYTSGQASLDNLIMTGDPQAMRDLVQNSRAQAEQSQSALTQAFKEGRITQDEMARGTRQIQSDLQQGVEQAQAALQEGLTQRAASGEGTYLKELKDKLTAGQGISAEDMQLLGLTGQERFNTNPNELLRNIEIDPNQYSIQDVANLTDVARADALARLSGEQEGENRFVNEQLGIDQLDRTRMEERATRAPEDEFTRTWSELTPEDQSAVGDFVQSLQSGQVFASPEQARQEIKNNSLTKYSLGPVADSLQQLIENGSTSTNYGSVSLDDVLAGDQNALGLLQDLNYWSHVSSTGQHGVATNPADIKRAVAEAYAKTQAMKSAYSGAEDNALRSESESAYVGQTPVDRIK